MSKYRSGQAVKVLFQQHDGTEIWFNAEINNIYADCIHVKYVEHIPGHDESLTLIKTCDIESRLRPIKEKQNVAKMKTSDFKENDVIEFKLKRKNQEDVWVPATVTYIGASAFVKINYTLNDATFGPQTVYECDYEDMIRITAVECKDKGESDIIMHDKQHPNGTKSNNADGSWITNKISGVYDGAISYLQHATDIVSTKREKAWNEKALSEWHRKDVVSWMKSMAAYEQYAQNIPNHMDGKELLDTTIDDLTLIIPKKLWRRRFMTQIKNAKEKYTKPQSNNDDDDDSKEMAMVNGVVGLHNLHNTCYTNTSIQILSQSPYITRYLKKRAKIKGNTKSKKYPMLNAWTHLSDIIYNQTKSSRRQYITMRPERIRDALKAMDTEFGAGSQDDSARALGYMLEALDEEIDEEIKNQKTKKKDVVYKQDIPIYHGRELNETEKYTFTNELLQDHNPYNSIVRKTFDGIEHITCQCLECNNVFQQFAIFRIIDLAVVSNEIQLNNINIVSNDKYYHIAEISMLDYCSIHLLQYHAVQHLLQQKQLQKIANYDVDIVVVSPNGKVYDVKNRKVSALQHLNGAIFVLMQSKHAFGRILQVDLAINKNGDKSKVLSIKYNAYNPYTIHEYALSQIKAHQVEDDEKYDYYINYNGNVFSTKELKEEKFKQNMHMEGVNVLFVLRVNRKTPKYHYDINDLDLKVLWESEDTKYQSSSPLKAVAQYKLMKDERINIWSKRDGYECIKDRVESEMSAIHKTMHVLQAKQDIVDITNNFVNLSHKYRYRFSTSTGRELTDLIQCLEEYQKPKIFDETSYEYPCPHYKSGANSRWVKVQKNIVHSPPIFLFHLDRYGKNMATNNTQKPSYHKGQEILVIYGYQSYKARILNVNSKGMNIKYLTDNTTEHIRKSKYWKKLPSYGSGSGSGGGNGYNNYGSNKFDHNINFKMQLSFCDEVYDLYGVSNHSGTTNGGHYTATIKCLTDAKWYDISDASVGSYNVEPLSHSRSATILAYVRKQD